MMERRTCINAFRTEAKNHLGNNHLQASDFWKERDEDYKTTFRNANSIIGPRIIGPRKGCPYRVDKLQMMEGHAHSWRIYFISIDPWWICNNDICNLLSQINEECGNEILAYMIDIEDEDLESIDRSFTVELEVKLPHGPENSEK